ncbi:MAG TPA: flavodoxin family protein [Chthoniobacterales bacterium]|nr:flavodoxin family protein [Chthoniobacterales bacterium]
MSPRVRTGQTPRRLSKDEFLLRWRQNFYDPAFEKADAELAKIGEIAWKAYHDSRKSPRTRKAGPGFADPEFELSIEWLGAREKIIEAQKRQESPDSPSRVLLICASPRTDQTCPSEMSKTFRLTKAAEEIFAAIPNLEVDLLDLSVLVAEYGRVIYPCKACVSTAMPLCHWPCSCYPNHYQGQVQDWMHEIYPRWVAAHGIMIITPVHWYQLPSTFKLMMDRLVCADGGNPDQTSTHGKEPEEAKVLELKGWHYPRHLAGRAFSVVVHGDTEGAESVRRALHDWLCDMKLFPAGESAVIDRYIGYYEPYATSHEALDRDSTILEETLNAARALVNAITDLRAGIRPADRDLKDPRPK